jgi:UDP-glucose 4-epimerase
MDWMPEDINYQTEKPVGVKHRAADTARAEDLLGWKPERSLSEGLTETIDWYVEQKDREYIAENLETLLHER